MMDIESMIKSLLITWLEHGEESMAIIQAHATII